MHALPKLTRLCRNGFSATVVGAPRVPGIRHKAFPRGYLRVVSGRRERAFGTRVALVLPVASVERAAYPFTHAQETTMLSWALTFLVIALVAALLGFGGIAGSAAGIAKILFFVFLVFFVISLLMGRRAKVE